MDTQPDSKGKLFYCAHCYSTSNQPVCPECKKAVTPAQEDDPILIGELPHALRNAFQIAFQAREIPFTAMPTLGSGFTLSAGDIFETYRVYVPLSRSEEAQEVLNGLLDEWNHS